MTSDSRFTGGWGLWRSLEAQGCDREAEEARRAIEVAWPKAEVEPPIVDWIRFDRRE